MCGIIGCASKEKNAIDVLIEGLSNLEYRGYDSCGIAFNDNSKIKIIKTPGKIKQLKNKVNDFKSNVGIGHTRWATHGEPNQINSHPHKVNNIILVHNGIIENYNDLKDNLIKNNIIFQSQTDSEVIAALISINYKKTKDKLKSIQETTKLLKGSYALGIIFEDESDSIYALRKDSPLIIALGKDKNLIASDVPAILEYTNKYILLEETEIAKIDSEKVIIYNKNLQEIEKQIFTYEGNKESIMKNGFEHFMLKEIYDEPNVINNIINSYVKNFDIRTLEKNFGDFSKYNKINIVACGSAAHAGYIGKSILEEKSNINTEVFLASEYRYNKIFHDKKTLTIVISQSGETADTLAALRKANDEKIDTLGIVNVVASSIAREAKQTIYLKAGSEISVATTKAFTAQMFILILISILISYQKRLINLEEANKILKEFKQLPEIINVLINNRDLYADIAKNIYKNDDIFFIGRKIDYSLCMEGSLKLKEISYIHSEAYASGELKHGTISLIAKNTPVISIVTDKTIEEKTISNIKETKARGSYVILITTEDLIKKYKNDDFYEKIIIIPKTNNYNNPILTIIPLQLLAYEVAKLKGENIDQPRNLAKSVTVE